MSRKHSELVSLGYLVAGIMILFPILDLAANLWPFQPTRANWRYGTYGLMSGYLLTVVLGFALAVAIGAWARQRGLVRIIGALSALTGILLLAVTVVNVLDTLQIRGTLPDDALTQFHIGSGKALVKNGIVTLSLLWIGWAGWRAAGQEAARADEKRPKDQKPLVGAASR
jgi:hypothetical protein